MKVSKLKHIGLWLTLTLSIAICAGCRPAQMETLDRQAADARSNTDPNAIQLKNTTAPSTQDATTIPLENLGMFGTEFPAGGNDAGWLTETWTRSIQSQLARVGAHLRTASETAIEELSFIASDDYSGASLRPKELHIALDGDGIRVLRASSSISSDSTSAQESDRTIGPEKLARTLAELQSPVKGAADIDNHFKVIHIEELSTGRVRATVLFEQQATFLDQITQQRAYWLSEWVVKNDNSVQLVSLRTKEYEETTVSKFNSPRPGLFQDSTRAVLAKNSSYVAQLVPSTDVWLDRLEFRYGIDPGAWLGLAIGDVNGDGREDIYFCQPGGLPNRLYVQASDGSAVDQSHAAAVDWLDHTHAALFADLDNDGDQDLTLAVKLGVVFMRNDGSGKFEVAAVRHVRQATPYALCAADYDADGLLDIYVACYSVRRQERDRQFIQRPVPYHDANNGGRNQLLRNNGSWRFADVTNQCGLDTHNRRFSFAASWEDYDNDRDPDLYVANDYGRNNLFRNDGGYFVDVAKEAGVEDISAGMSVTWGDANNDGWMDLYVSNMFSSAGNRIAYQRQFRSTDRPAARSAYQRHAKGNSLFLNTGQGDFHDASESAGVQMGRWAWSSIFADVNNDGWEDILVANGFITQSDTTDL